MVPFNWPEDGLCTRDFMLLELQFYRTVSYFLPCESVHFVTEEQFPGSGEGRKQEECDYPETWKAGVNLVRKERRPVVNEGGSVLFLPIWQNEKIMAVSVLSGGKSIQYGEYSAEWLHERSRLVSRELRKTKQWAFDTESGLLTGQHLRENVEMLLLSEARSASPKAVERGDGKVCDSFWSVLLLEIFPKVRNSGQSSGDIARAGACLNSFVGDLVPLSHFGSGLFGMLWHGDGQDEFRTLGYALLRKLKRQNFSRVHIGIAPVKLAKLGANGAGCAQLAEHVLAEAWAALKEARRRGPFALCSISGEKAAQIFREPLPHTLAALKKLWQTSSKFSLIFLQEDGGKEEGREFPKRIRTLVGEEGYFFAENRVEAFVFLPDMDGRESRKWVDSFKKKIAGLNGPTYSIGIASFPCDSFTKSDIPVNARKALAHTAFYGPDTVTAFDGVSLNISGDVYYNEGDLTSAVREYKRGLKLDPDNINLMNSLAVIYAQVNRYHLAVNLFEKVLRLDPRDFMALFNLAFAYLRRKDLANAQKYFQKALAVDDTYFDLLLQLGQIYCATGQFKKAVAILSKAEKTVSVSPSRVEGKSWQANEAGGAGKDIGRGLVYSCLGQAYQGVGDKKTAMGYFQRAIGYNPKDAESLSRLGELYLEEKQGNEIALSLCRQAVDLEEGNPVFWQRLGRAYLSTEDFSGAVEALEQGLANDRKSVSSLLMLAAAYKKMGREQKAIGIYKRVLKLDGKNKQAIRALK